MMRKDLSTESSIRYNQQRQEERQTPLYALVYAPCSIVSLCLFVVDVSNNDVSRIDLNL